MRDELFILLSAPQTFYKMIHNQRLSDWRIFHSHGRFGYVFLSFPLLTDVEVRPCYQLHCIKVEIRNSGKYFSSFINILLSYINSLRLEEDINLILKEVWQLLSL